MILRLQSGSRCRARAWHGLLVLLCLLPSLACSTDAPGVLYTLQLGDRAIDVRSVSVASYSISSTDSSGYGNNADDATDPNADLGASADPNGGVPTPTLQIVLSSASNGCAALSADGQVKSSTSLTLKLVAYDPNGTPLPILPGTYSLLLDGTAGTGNSLTADFRVSAFDKFCQETNAGASLTVQQGTVTLKALAADGTASGSFSFTLANGQGGIIAHDFVARPCAVDASAYQDTATSTPCL